MKPGVTQYSNLIKTSSSQLYYFIRKLGYKENERLQFVLVQDAKRSTSSNSTSSNSNTSNNRHAILLQKPLKLMEKRVPEIKLFTKNNKPVHVLSQNARGYAVFMQINYGEKKDSKIKEIKAQFIDVDLNKISACLNTREQVKQKMISIRSNPVEQIESVTVKRNKQGQYQLLALRTEQRVTQLKKEFLKKYWKHIRNAMIIETSNGYHIYWPVQGGSLSKFVPIQEALVKKFGSDPMITNLTRDMRIPGFYHMKNPRRPFLVRVIHWGRKTPFTQNELINTMGLKSYIMQGVS
ncbi:hypothetical protein [Ammoniphilus sp. YIM 78166]|uniref:DNA-primase RepB domain-containing protein n=1 Tax=Ammoniphilus sp. YIM 78166 TaxID=1644106 RepID=UPI001070061F|nr:hypothetical protein [Ammoniphilus sp. YIM 78166]